MVADENGIFRTASMKKTQKIILPKLDKISEINFPTTCREYKTHFRSSWSEVENPTSDQLRQRWDSVSFLHFYFLIFIKSNFPCLTDTVAVSPGNTSLLTPYWYSQEISASASGYFAPVMVIPLAQPVIFNREKNAY